ncbi:MAG: AraC family transcriptional regulator [Arenicella sp.]
MPEKQQFKSVLYISCDFQLYIGRLLAKENQPASPCQLFAFALEGEMNVSLNNGAMTISPKSIFYRRKVERRSALDGIYAYLFLEPGNRYRQILQYRMTQIAEHAYANIDDAEGFQHLFENVLLNKPDIETVAGQLDNMILNNKQHLLYEEDIDPRVITVMKVIKEEPKKNFTVEELAQQVYLSPSRLMGLFKKEAGMTLGKYNSFNKLIYAYYLLAQGQNLSAAASNAGFYDDSHLSKTSKKFLGILPSLLFSSQVSTKVISTIEF